MAETTIVGVAPEPAIGHRISSYVEWAPILAGAVAAAAISLILLAFGSAIGLSTASPWPDSASRGGSSRSLARCGFCSFKSGATLSAGIWRAGFAHRLMRCLRPNGAFVMALMVSWSGRLERSFSAVLVGWTVGAVVKTGVDAASTVAGTAIARDRALAAGALAAEPDPFGYNVDRLLRRGSASAAGPSDASAAPDLGNAQRSSKRRLRMRLLPTRRR